MNVKLVPHIYKQEAYIGKDLVIVDHESELDPPPQNRKRIPSTCSPVNFFEPDYSVYPLFEDVERKYTVLLHDGDCLFIPAYYFYQFSGKAEMQPD
jgi:hypothetical protein